MIKIDKELERLLLSILNEGGIHMAYEAKQNDRGIGGISRRNTYYTEKLSWNWEKRSCGLRRRNALRQVLTWRRRWD